MTQMVDLFRAGGALAPIRFSLCLGLAVIMCGASPALAQKFSSEPTFVDGKIHCSDGSTHDYSLSNGEPDALVMRMVCKTPGASASLAAPSPAPAPSDAGLANMPSLRHPASEGTLRCPDGSTRPFKGEQPGDLAVNMACAVPANVAAENERRGQIAWDAKNREARLRDALAGKAGIWEALKASWETGSLDYLLSIRAIWFAAIALLLFGLIRIFGRAR